MKCLIMSLHRFMKVWVLIWYYLPAEFRAIDEEWEVAQLDFGPKNAIFEKPKEPATHLKPLFLKGHINGSPVARMLVDGGAVVNLMPYSVFKNWGCVMKS